MGSGSIVAALSRTIEMESLAMPQLGPSAAIFSAT
jgi:hypothetical protein